MSAKQKLLNRPQRLLIGAVLAALMAGGCSNNSTSDSAVDADASAPDLAFADEAQIQLGRELSELEIELVDLEVSWLCAGPRQVFDTASAIEEAREDHLAASGISSENYAEFRDNLDLDEDLRKAVLVGYQQGC